MVSTVTVSTITAIAVSGAALRIGIFATLLLIGFLTTKEVLGASSDNRQKLLARSLIVSIAALAIGFAAIVGFKVAEILA